MTKKIKIIIILTTAVALFLYWLALAVTGTKYEMINYWWQAGLAFVAILYGIFGMLAAKHWSWLKSGVGQGVFFISLGLIMWGIGQAGWTYLVIKDPSSQTPPSHILDILYFSSVPLWAYGTLRLSKATGARYGLRSPLAKVGVVLLTLIMFAISYYFLVVVARGGFAYVTQDTFLNVFFNLGYAAGDAVNLTLALAVFGLSWKFLGGRFKRPIILILFAFLVVYLADFLYSFYDGKGQYYNGHWVDLLYVVMAAMFGIGLCMLDPTDSKTAVPAVAAQPLTPAPVTPVAPVTPITPAAQPPQPAPAPEMPGLGSEPPDQTPPAQNGGSA